MSLESYILKKPLLETDNLILRVLTTNDTDDLSEWLGDTSLYKYWEKRPSKSDLNPKLMFNNINSKPTKSFHWGIVHKTDNKVIGEFYVYLIENNRMAKVSYRLSNKHQGKGLMTEALKRVVKFSFEDTELMRLWTDVDINNVASYKVLEKCGFEREGYIRQGVWCLFTVIIICMAS